MQVTATRAKLVLLVLAVALVGLGVWAWEPLVSFRQACRNP